MLEYCFYKVILWGPCLRLQKSERKYENFFLVLIKVVHNMYYAYLTSESDTKFVQQLDDVCIEMQVIHSFEGEAPGELSLVAGDYVVVRQV